MLAFGSVLIGLAFTVLASSASAAGIKIGVIAPQSGNYASLGQQILTGARVAAASQGNEIDSFDETCEEGSGAKVADALVAAKVDFAIGFLCAESLENSLDALKKDNIPAITLSVRSPILMEDALKKGWPFFRLAPDNQAEQRKLIEIILATWTDQPFAILEDGTIHSRELAEALRNALEEKGMKPAFTDTIRPGQEQQISLVRRLVKAGITRVFLSADRSDVSILARDAIRENAKLIILSGDTMMAADASVPLAAGVQAVIQSAPQPTEEAIAATIAIAETGNDKALVVEGYMLPAYAATTIAGDAAALSATNGKSKAENLINTPFKTAIGQIQFSQNHELTENPYALHVWQAGKFIPANPPTVPVN